MATEGVDYAALLSTNFNPGGADYAGIQELESLLDSAASRCPNSKIVVSGYRYVNHASPHVHRDDSYNKISQGAALVHRAVEDRAQSVKDKIVGVVTYGDTQNLQDGGRIQNFPTQKLKVICNTGDLVCSGTLTITSAHLDYARRVSEAVSFLSARIRA